MHIVKLRIVLDFLPLSSNICGDGFGGGGGNSSSSTNSSRANAKCHNRLFNNLICMHIFMHIVVENTLCIETYGILIYMNA